MAEQDQIANRLVSELADDPDMVELVEMYVSELPERIAAIEQSLADEDLSTLARLAHQMKGAAGGYGFPTITSAALELEMSAKAQEELEAVTGHVNAIADLCARASASPDGA